MRHGPAAGPTHPDFSDEARSLTPAGAALMRAAAAGLARRLASGRPPPALILHSPLKRARQTAEIVAAALPGTPLQMHALLEPGCDLTSLESILDERPEAGALLVVGHNPDLTVLVGALTGAEARFGEGTVACVRRPASGRGELIWIDTAETLAAA